VPRTVTVTFKDGTSHVYEGVPDDATPIQVEARAAQDFAGKQVTKLDGGGAAPAAPAPAASAGPIDMGPEGVSVAAQIPGALLDTAKSAGDTALSLGTGAVAAPVSGLAGLVAAPFVGADRAADIVRNVGSAMTWKPRSKAGERTAAAIAKPLEYVTDKADRVGQVAADATGSPLVGAAVTTAIQGAPVFLAPEVRGAFNSVATSAAKGGAAAVRGVGTAARATTSVVDAAKAAAAQAKAKTYAGTSGLDWNSLGDATRAQLTKIAADGGDFTGLDPAALAREAKLAALPVPVPATRGQITRNPAQMRREANAAATPEGAPIQQTYDAANDALIQNLDVLKGKVSGTGKTAATATNLEGAGGSVQGAARGKLELQKAKVKAAYEAADSAGETLAPVDATGVLGTVGDTIDQPHYGYAQSWLKANAPKIDSGTLSIRDLEKLRKQAVAKAMNGGEDGHYAGELIKSIDAATEGAGGDLYKAARKARRDQALEFQEQGAVADLVDNASRTDRTTALENTVRSVTTGSLEDIRKVKTTLLTGGDATTRTAGRQAWRDVRAQVIQKIRDDATKSAATTASGADNLQVGALKRSIDALGPDKLEELFGPGTAKQLQKILDAARDVKTMPAGGPPVGSTTLQNILTFLGKGLDKVPLVGGPAVDIARGIAKVKNIGQATREAKAANVTPLTDAVSKAAGRARIGKKGDAAPLVPLSALYDQQQKAARK
jgi:hypothetical protein